MSPARRNLPLRMRFEEAERTPRNPPPRTRFENEERPPLRDPPPHRAFTSEPQMGERRPMTCFGCGARGHRMDACEKIEAFITQGTIQRIAGKLRWSDGSAIFREQEETWVDAITRRVQGENKAKEGKKVAQDKGVYFVDIVRQDSDADSDDQEGLGWESATAAVHHLKSYGVDRPQKISRNARKSAQSDPPAHPHRMRQLPSERNVKGPGRVEGPVPHQKDIHRAKNHPFPTTPMTPIDISPKQFEDKGDAELVPMEVEEAVIDKPIDHIRKVATRKPESAVRDIVDAGPKPGKAQMSVVKDVLQAPLTIRVQQLVSLSPIARRALLKALRDIRDDPAESADILRIEKPLEASKKDARVKEVLRVDMDFERERIQRGIEEDKRGRKKLLVLKAKIGNAVLEGIVDSGSSANIISARKAAETGLPIERLDEDSFPVTGLKGPPIGCEYMIPRAIVYVSEKKYPTYGDLFIVDGITVDLLYGRPWMVDNYAGIQEKPLGTYVSWVSNHKPYELNVLPNFWWMSENRDNVEFVRMKEEEEAGSFATSLVTRAGNGTDQSYRISSSENRSSPSEVDYQADSDDDEDDKEAVRWANSQVEGWKREQKQREKGKERAREDSTPPPNQLGRRKLLDEPFESQEFRATSKRQKTTGRRRQIIEVDREVQEEFARMVEEDASDSEWRAFCTREKKRRAERDKNWLAWIEQESSDSPVRVTHAETPDEIEIFEDPAALETEVDTPPREPSLTLETPPEKSPESVREEESREIRTKNTELVVRRSRRSRRRTEKGLYEDRMRPKGRTYQRHETASRTMTRRTQPQRDRETPKPGSSKPPVFSLCLQIDPGVLEAAESRVGRRRGEESRIEEIYDDVDALDANPGPWDEIEDLPASQPVFGNQSDENRGLLESEIDSPGTEGDSAGPANELHLRLAEEGKPEKVSGADVSVRSAVDKMNTGLRAPDNGTEYQPLVPSEIYGTHLLDDEIEESPTPSTWFSAWSACCATNRNSVRASSEWVVERDPRTGGGSIGKSPQAEFDDKRHLAGVQNLARQDSAQPESEGQLYSEDDKDVETNSRTKSGLRSPAISPDRQREDGSRRESQDSACQEVSCDELRKRESRRTYLRFEEVERLPLHTERYQGLRNREWVNREEMLARISEVLVKILTEDYPIAQSRRPINEVVETSTEECEFCKEKKKRK